MKKSMPVLAVSVFVVALTASAAEKAKNYVFVPAADLKWADVPNVPEVKVAAVEGDPAKGAHHAIHKFAAGFTAPMHHHTADHYVTVIQGNVTLTIDGTETKLGPGSFFQFTKKQLHSTKCETGADCLLSIDCRGKWDVVPVKDAAKKDAPAEKK